MPLRMWHMRKFGGKDYRLVGEFTYKSGAQQRAREVRKSGHLARVVKEGKTWCTYSRAKSGRFVGFG